MPFRAVLPDYSIHVIEKPAHRGRIRFLFEVFCQKHGDVKAMEGSTDSLNQLVGLGVLG